jgi:toxin ParE1/3/4
MVRQLTLMSAPSNFIFSPRARRDIIGIVQYTALIWGKAQSQRYQRKIDVALNKIAANPNLGSQRFEMPSPLRHFLVGTHIVIFRVNNESTEIVRILHQSMDRRTQWNVE